MAELIKDKNALKDGMTPRQVLEFLTGLGVQGSWVDESKLVFETACHNHLGEGKHKLYYYDNTKLFYCYTGCGRFDIFELLNKMNVIKSHEELSLDEAVDLYVKSQSFIALGSSDRTNAQEDLNLEYTKPVFHYYDKQEFLNLPRVIVSDWEREGISAQTQHKYNVRFNYSQTSIAFPHLDENYNLLGIRQRILNPEMIERSGKYRPLERKGIMYSSPLSFYLFGLAFNKFNIEREKKAIVFEGEKSCLKLDDLLGERNNIGTSSSGMHFSRHQYESLKEHGVKEIIFAYDRQFEDTNSMEFIKCFEVYKTIYERFGKNKDGIKLSFIFDENKLTGYKDAPVDCGFDIFNTLYHSKRTFEELKNDVRPDTEWDNLSELDGEDGDIY